MSDTIEQAYSHYYDIVKQIISTNHGIDQFKHHPRIIDIFEHVSDQSGHEYYSLLQTTSLINQQIRQYCEKNDLIGGGTKYMYGPEWRTSPTNFRYLYHAHLVLTHLRQLSPNLPLDEWIEQSMVEVGCGYGGLCLAIIDLAPHYHIQIPHYHLIDLPAISELQKQYHTRIHERIPNTSNTILSYHSAFEYGKDIPDKHGLFFISNYCFSEISAEHQEHYRTHLLTQPYVSHGFMAWNHIPLYDFGYSSSLRSESEIPLTGKDNLYVYF